MYIFDLLLAFSINLGVMISLRKDKSDEKIGYSDILIPGGLQFHPSIVTIMGQVNQALTGYGAVSVYGPQIFELLGFPVRMAEYLTLGNYISYFLTMTIAWMTIDVLGQNKLMVWEAVGLATSFLLLTIIGGLATTYSRFSSLAFGISGSIVLYVATTIFGICWLSNVWIIQ